MNLITLKLKIKTLAAESRIIRREVIKQKRVFREMLVRERLAKGGLSEKQMARIIRRAKGRNLNFQRAGLTNNDQNTTLVFDQRPSPPKPEWIREKDFEITGSHLFRKLIVRAEARASLLAYTFLRGHPYSRAEVLGHDRRNAPSLGRSLKPDWDNVKAIAEQYAPGQEVKDQISAWIDEATAYRIEQGVEVKQKKDEEQAA